MFSPNEKNTALSTSLNSIQNVIRLGKKQERPHSCRPWEL